MKNEFLKSRGLLRPDATVAMRCALLEAEKASYPITWMCDQLGGGALVVLRLARRSRHRDRHRARRQLLAQLVKVVFDGSHGSYSCRRVAAELNRQAHPASVGLVVDLMRELGLLACQPRSYKTTTVAGDRPVASPVIPAACRLLRHDPEWSGGNPSGAQDSSVATTWPCCGAEAEHGDEA